MIKDGFYQDDFLLSWVLVKNNKCYFVFCAEVQVCITEDGKVAEFGLSDANCEENQDWIQNANYEESITLCLPWANEPMTFTVDSIDTSKSLFADDACDVCSKYDWDHVSYDGSEFIDE